MALAGLAEGVVVFAAAICCECFCTSAALSVAGRCAIAETLGAALAVVGLGCGCALALPSRGRGLWPPWGSYSEGLMI